MTATIACDIKGCKNRFYARWIMSEQHAWENAREDGWRCDQDGDICPEHVAAGA